MPTPRERFESGFVRTEEGCWLWQRHRDRQGYGMLWWNKTMTRTHRVAWEIANGPIPAGLSICHRCDTPACVRLSHLFIATHRANMADMHAKGRANTARGERQHSAKLTADAVRAIRAQYPKKTLHELAVEFGVSHAAVHYVVVGQTWRHVV